MKIALIGAGSSVGRHLLSLDDPRYLGIYRSPKALSQLCDLDVGSRLVQVSSGASLAKAVVGVDTVVTLINDENPRAALNSLREVVEVCIAMKVPQLIHLGSAAIYGAYPSRAKESASAGQAITWNSYAAGKQWQENYLKSCRALPPSTVVLRPGLIWGPGMAWLHMPAGELLRGEAWVIEGDAACNLVNINFLTHAILRLTETRPSGLTFTNVRDRERYTWAQYYERIARQFGIENFKLTHVRHSDPHSWKRYPGAARSMFPLGLAWSVAPRPFKNVVKRIAKALPKKGQMGSVTPRRAGHGLMINRELWELKSVDGLPPTGPLLEDLQHTYARTSQEDWAELDKLRPWMVA